MEVLANFFFFVFCIFLFWIFGGRGLFGGVCGLSSAAGELIYTPKRPSAQCGANVGV
jgi:hypothetical protein